MRLPWKEDSCCLHARSWRASWPGLSARDCPPRWPGWRDAGRSTSAGYPNSAESRWTLSSPPTQNTPWPSCLKTKISLWSQLKINYWKKYILVTWLLKYYEIYGLKRRQTRHSFLFRPSSLTWNRSFKPIVFVNYEFNERFWKKRKRLFLVPILSSFIKELQLKLWSYILQYKPIWSKLSPNLTCIFLIWIFTNIGVEKQVSDLHKISSTAENPRIMT